MQKLQRSSPRLSVFVRCQTSFGCRPAQLMSSLSQKQRRLRAYPNATSSTIITLKPTAKKTVPMLECFPCDISGISSSTTT